MAVIGGGHQIRAGPGGFRIRRWPQGESHASAGQAPLLRQEVVRGSRVEDDHVRPGVSEEPCHRQPGPRQAQHCHPPGTQGAGRD